MAILFAVLVIPVSLLVIVVLAIGVVVGRHGDSSSTPPRASAPTSSLPHTDAEVAWKVEPGTLRPDLPKPTFVSSLDGAFAESYVSEEAGRWLGITGTEDDTDTVLHALDPETGAERWQRRLDGVLCATEAPSSGLLCASVLERDPRTGLGIRWQLHLIDPATGADRLTRDIDGWLTAVHYTAETFVVLEQRQPAPHAALQAYDATTLRPRWTRDLAGQSGEAEMFSSDRIVLREEPKRIGLALDRPRLRDVGSGLVALWAGQRTAFVQVSTGRLVMMPHCSRLVDDGKRLWCNEVDGVTAYGYDGRRLFGVRGPRLAYPTDDGVGLDRARPVFIDDDGAGVSVNPTTGKVGAVYTPPGRGSAFGMVTMPNVYHVGDETFLIGKAGAMLIDSDRDRVVWRNAQITVSDLPLRVGDHLLFGNSRLTVVDPTTGVASAEIRADATGTVAVGSRFAGVGSDGISRLRLS